MVPHRGRRFPRRRRVPHDRRPPGRGDQPRRGEGLPGRRSSRRSSSPPRGRRGRGLRVPHRTLGEDLAAAVRPHAETARPLGEPRAHLSDPPRPFKVPRRIVLVETVPRGPTGKPLRSAMAELPRARCRARARRRADADLLERRLGALWGEALEGGDAGPEQDFFDLGGDSLAAVALLAAIEEELDVALELEDLIEAPTPRGLARRDPKVPRARGPPAPDGPQRGRRPHSGALTPLSRSPADRATPCASSCWGASSAATQPVYGLQPPGMDWEAAGVRALPEMAAHHVQRIREIQPRGPYRLLGSSFGGLLAFEMALQLEGAGDDVEFLGMIDTKPAAFARRWDILRRAQAAARAQRPRGGRRRRRRRRRHEDGRGPRRGPALLRDLGAHRQRDHPLRLRLRGRAGRGRAAPSVGGRDRRWAAGRRDPGPACAVRPRAPVLGSARRPARVPLGRRAATHRRPRRRSSGAPTRSSGARRERPSSTPPGPSIESRSGAHERAGEPGPASGGGRCSCAAGRATPSAAARARRWWRSSTGASPAIRPAAHRPSASAQRLDAPGLRHAGFRLWLKPARRATSRRRASSRSPPTGGRRSCPGPLRLA